MNIFLLSNFHAICFTCYNNNSNKISKKKKTTKTISIIKYHECVTIKQKRKIAEKNFTSKCLLLTVVAGCWWQAIVNSSNKSQSIVLKMHIIYVLHVSKTKKYTYIQFLRFFRFITANSKQQNSNLVLSLTVSNISTPNLILCIRGIHETEHTWFLLM